MIANVTLKVEVPDDIAKRLYRVGDWDWEALVCRSFEAGDSRAAYELIVTVESAEQDGPGVVKDDGTRAYDEKARSERRQERDTYRKWDKEQLEREGGPA